MLSCICHCRPEKPRWSFKHASCQSERAPTMMRHYFLPSLPQPNVASFFLLRNSCVEQHQNWKPVSESQLRHQHHWATPLACKQSQSSFLSRSLCWARQEMEIFNWICSCKACLQTRQEILQSFYTLHMYTTNFLQQQEASLMRKVEQRDTKVSPKIALLAHCRRAH